MLSLALVLTLVTAFQSSFAQYVNPPPLKRHVLIGYWHNFIGAGRSMRLRDVPANFDIVNIAFGLPNSTAGAVVFNVDPALARALGGYTETQFRNDIRFLQSRNQAVVLSVGGYTGFIDVSTTARATQFGNSLCTLMRTWGFQGIDIDIETNLAANRRITPGPLERGLRIAKQCHRRMLLTYTPQTYDMQPIIANNPYITLIRNTRDILNISNIQFYNSGVMLGRDNRAYSAGTVDFITAQVDLAFTLNLRPDQVALGVVATRSAATWNGYVSPMVVRNATLCIHSRRNCSSYIPVRAESSLRGIMVWSINWDASQNYSFYNAISPFLRSLP